MGKRWDTGDHGSINGYTRGEKTPTPKWFSPQSGSRIPWREDSQTIAHSVWAPVKLGIDLGGVFSKGAPSPMIQEEEDILASVALPLIRYTL